MASGLMRGSVSYNGCLNITVNKTGIRLSLLVIFRFFHPPISIPWDDIETTDSVKGGYDMIVLKFRRNRSLTLALRKRIGEEVLMAKDGVAHPL
jgi:hypothetical protein